MTRKTRLAVTRLTLAAAVFAAAPGAALAQAYAVAAPMGGISIEAQAPVSAIDASPRTLNGETGVPGAETAIKPQRAHTWRHRLGLQLQELSAHLLSDEA